VAKDGTVVMAGDMSRWPPRTDCRFSSFGVRGSCGTVESRFRLPFRAQPRDKRLLLRFSTCGRSGVVGRLQEIWSSVVSAVSGLVGSTSGTANASCSTHPRPEPVERSTGSAGTGGASSAAGLPPNQLLRFLRLPSDLAFDRLKPRLLRFADLSSRGEGGGCLIAASEKAAAWWV